MVSRGEWRDVSQYPQNTGAHRRDVTRASVAAPNHWVRSRHGFPRARIPSSTPYHALSRSSRARRRAAFIKCYTLDRILERNAGTFCIMARNSCVLAGTLFPLIKQLRYYVVYATIFIPAALRQHYLYRARGNMRDSGWDVTSLNLPSPLWY